jgi:hypothetical protein
VGTGSGRRTRRESGAGVVGKLRGAPAAEGRRCSGGGGGSAGEHARRRRVLLSCLVRFGWPFSGAASVMAGSPVRDPARRWISA